MRKIAYYRDKIDCPECGLPTNYLQEATESYITGKGELAFSTRTDQKTLMCEDCLTEEE